MGCGRPASDNVTGAAVEVEHRRHARDELMGVKPMIASINPEHPLSASAYRYGVITQPRPEAHVIWAYLLSIYSRSAR